MFDFLRKAGIAISADYVLSQVRIAHLIPGRIRIIWPDIKKDAALAAEVDKSLSAAPAVSSYRINSVTGSILIEFEQQQIKDNPFLEVLLKKAQHRYASKGY